jgi:hypothetical protein
METLLPRIVVFVALFALASPVTAAKPDLCGNGRVQAGEWCDTGGDSPTCDGDCSPVDCGDGYVNAAAGEQCDTAGESATCDADCSPPACGDQHVNPAAGEECDGNTPATVTCVSCALACAAPAASCTDGARNGTETDVDCGGGACAACAAGMQCLVDTDCVTASCAGGTCAEVQGAPVAAVFPVTLNFGNVLVGTSSAMLTVTVRNDGTAPLLVSSIVASSAEFSVDPSGPFTVLPGQQWAQSVRVRFAPTSPGAKTESLTFSTNDPASGTTTIGLFGTGI